MDTIVALSSGALPAGVAVIRLSGPQAFEAAAAFIEGSIVPDRSARLVTIIDPVSRETLDRGLVLGFVRPASFTGEDVVELHLHGSRAVVDDLLRLLSDREGIRIAEPGEFTRRAFMNGKLDLVTAEALGDLIEAQTAAQRRMAHSAGSGALHEEYTRWRALVLRLRAMIEADIDFADEDDVPGSVVDEVFDTLPTLIADIEKKLVYNRNAERIRDGFRVVIYGPPNAGKSTLLNALAGRDAAIVTDIPGTTRDLIEVQLDVGGFLVRIVDTAGVRDVSDPVEAVGVERAVAAVKDADVVLELSETGSWLEGVKDNDAWLRVLSKSDIGKDTLAIEADARISAKERLGLDGLLDLLEAKLQGQIGTDLSRVNGNRRHAAKMQSALVQLRLIDATCSLEINAEYLRLASVQLSELTGVVGQEEMLGEIFSAFCIGK